MSGRLIAAISSPRFRRHEKAADGPPPAACQSISKKDSPSKALSFLASTRICTGTAAITDPPWLRRSLAILIIPDPFHFVNHFPAASNAAFDGTIIPHLFVTLCDRFFQIKKPGPIKPGKTPFPCAYPILGGEKGLTTSCAPAIMGRQEDGRPAPTGRRSIPFGLMLGNCRHLSVVWKSVTFWVCLGRIPALSPQERA